MMTETITVEQRVASLEERFDRLEAGVREMLDLARAVTAVPA